MSSHTIRQLVIATGYMILALMALLACNGSGGGGDLLAGGGIGGTGISIGAISGFGSVIVNDVDFDTQKAQVVVNGRPVGVGNSVVRNELALGMVVRVEGRYRADGTGEAERIVFNENVKGPVTSIEILDSVAKKLVVLGQMVIVDEQTQIKDTDFKSIAVGQVLQVSGWSEGGGIIRATYAKNLDPSDPNLDEVTIKGVVSEANNQRWFRINQLVVDIFENAVPLPVVGQLVIVNGILDDKGILVATALSIENELGLDDAESVEIEGIVSQVSSPADFILGTTAVQTDEATSFIGLEPADIVPGARLLVKGALSKGVLLADEIKAKDKVNIEGKVANIHKSLGEITLSGLSPLVVRVNSVTKIFGDASKLTDIKEGQQVKILGYAAAEDQVVASQIKVDKKDRARVKLQGPITHIDRPIISIFKVDIDTAEIPDDGFYTTEEGSVSRNDFLDLATEGDTVGVNGNLIGDGVEWKGIELLQE